MCGILGVSVSGNDVPEIRVKQERFLDALKLISHRGPDAIGDYSSHDNSVRLGHTRLSILDLSASGNQPMLTQDCNFVIVFNGEIYNFKRLKSTLINLGYSFLSESDTEVILALYQEYGEKMLSMLDGIFAIAVYDVFQNEMIVARDGLGVKPLYYFTDENKFIFSSEVKAIEGLLADAELVLDMTSLNRYLSFQWCPGEGTPFKNIRKLNPGSFVKVKDGKITQKGSFYKLPIFTNIRKNDREDVNSIITDLTGHLRRSVHDQMIADAPLGAFLSGGLDSTSVVAFAKEIDPGIKCFTIDTRNEKNDGLTDDLPYAKRAAKYLNVPLEIVKIDSGSMVKNLEKMVWHLDEPLGDPAPLNVLYISQLAKEQGIKVLLSGAGGDDIFTGYRRHRAIASESLIQLLPDRLLSAIEIATGRLDSSVTSFRRLAKLFSGASLDENDRIVNYFRWISQKNLAGLYSDDFRAEVASVNAEQPMLEFLSEANSSASKLDKMLALEQRFFTTDHNLIYTDKMAMAAGVEVRVPLLARDLVRYAYTIPDKYKQRGSVGKWIFKKAMEPYLPSDIIYRSKTGFGAPLRGWLKFELLEVVNDLLSDRSLAARGLFNANSVRRLIALNFEGKIDASYTIFSLMCIEIWCRQHIDGLGYKS